jgi:signal peptidase II
MSEDQQNLATPVHNERRERNYLGLFLFITAAVVALDRITKRLVVAHLSAGSTYTVIPRIFRISHVLNTGAAFSAFADTTSPEIVRKALIGFSILAVLIVAYMLLRVRNQLSLTTIALSLILGGAIGNLYDRIVYHYVIDFLEVRIIHYHWPDFNVADSCIVIGACLLLIEIFRPQSHS